jgi:hypothetical protein
VVKPAEVRQLSLALAKTKTELKVISSPLDAEVYLNKVPGKRTMPDKHTPTVFSGLNEKSVRVAFFKLGYRDTAFSIPISAYQMNNCFVELSKTDGRETARQKAMIAARKKVGISYYFFGGSVAAGIGSGAIGYLSSRDFAKARDAKNFLEKTVLDPSSPVYQSKITENNEKARSGNFKLGCAVLLLGAAACSLGTGLVLYF